MFWDYCSHFLCFCVCWFVTTFVIYFVCVCVISLQFCNFYVFFIFSQLLLQFLSILIFFSHCNFYVSWFFWVFVANLMFVNFCLSFCYNFYVCWLLSKFFLQFLCVLIFVSVFVAICECVDLSQFLQFLWVLICLRFLELSIVFLTLLALKRGRRWTKGSQQWVTKWRSFSRSQHKLTSLWRRRQRRIWKDQTGAKAWQYVNFFIKKKPLYKKSPSFIRMMQKYGTKLVV